MSTLEEQLRRLAYVLECMDENSPEVQKAAADAIAKAVDEHEIRRRIDTVCYLISAGQAIAWMAKNIFGGGKIYAVKMVKDFTGWKPTECEQVVEYLMERHKHDS